MTLIEALQTTLRRLHDSPRTEEAYVYWTRAFVRFHHRRHPREMGAAEVTAFLNDLAVRQRVSASTQNQALCARVFLYRRVLSIEVPDLVNLERAQRPTHLPVVLARSDVLALLDRLEPPFRLIAELLYGAGLRLGESVSLRVKDVDLERHPLTVRRGKGQRDRAALLPARARERPRTQLDTARDPTGAPPPPARRSFFRRTDDLRRDGGCSSPPSVDADTSEVLVSATGEVISSSEDPIPASRSTSRRVSRSLFIMEGSFFVPKSSTSRPVGSFSPSRSSSLPAKGSSRVARRSFSRSRRLFSPSRSSFSHARSSSRPAWGSVTNGGVGPHTALPRVLSPVPGERTPRTDDAWSNRTEVLGSRPFSTTLPVAQVLSPGTGERTRGSAVWGPTPPFVTHPRVGVALTPRAGFVYLS